MRVGLLHALVVKKKAYSRFSLSFDKLAENELSLKLQSDSFDVMAN